MYCEKHMEISDDSLPLSSLLCEEDDSCFNQNNCKDVHLYPSSISDCDDNYIEMLIERETNFQSNSNASSCDFSVKNEHSWLKCARLDAIQWILNTRAFFGFHFRTAYLSLVYFDRFFSRRSIEDGKLWAIRLLSVACLSLAAKMEECRVPALSEYHIEEYNFKASVIQRMEFLVLHTLEWKMNAVTPFAYVHYFIAKFCESSSKELLSKAIELILAIVKEINLVEHQPSVIAAAAVLAAYDYQLTRKIVDNKMSIISSWGSQEKEHLFRCYNLLQEIETAKVNTPKPQSPLNVLICGSPRHALENSSISSAFGSKRRLTYGDCDHHCPSHKIHRP